MFAPRRGHFDVGSTPGSADWARNAPRVRDMLMLDAPATESGGYEMGNVGPETPETAPVAVRRPRHNQ